jgi:hypothetical protein
MLTPERKETRMSLAGDLITMANKDSNFSVRTIRDRRKSSCNSDDSTGRVNEKWFPGMLPNAL